MSESTESTQPAVPMPNRRNSLVRDAVITGIFIALYIVLFSICGMTMGAIPLIIVLFPMTSGILGGLTFMALLGEAQRTGIFLITGLTTRLMMISMALGGVMCYTTIASGVVAEVIYWSMGHKFFASMTAAYTAFVTLFVLGEYIPFVWMKDAYLEFYVNNPTLGVAKAGMDMLSPVIMAMYCLLAIVARVVGCFWGRALTRRQFSRVGIV